MNEEEMVDAQNAAYNSLTYQTFRDCLRHVQQIEGGDCKHGVFLCECMEDCLVCFVEALELFSEGVVDSA